MKNISRYDSFSINEDDQNIVGDTTGSGFDKLTVTPFLEALSGVEGFTRDGLEVSKDQNGDTVIKITYPKKRLTITFSGEGAHCNQGSQGWKSRFGASPKFLK